MSTEWASQYANGATVEQIALDAGTCPKTVRKHLHALGVAMRPRGERAGVERRPGPLSGDTQGAPEPSARIVRPSMVRWMR